MKRKIILLNGAPNCGKDTIANLCYQELGTTTLSFKTPMFDIARAILGAIDYNEFIKAYNDRDTKEAPMQILNGRSPRQFMIWISEDVIKPEFGNAYFGDRLARSAMYTEISVVSDCGFWSEVKPLIDCDKLDVHLVRLHRTGCSFAGDSRSHIYLPDDYQLKANEYDLNLVDGSPDLAVDFIQDLIEEQY